MEAFPTPAEPVLTGLGELGAKKPMRNWDWKDDTLGKIVKIYQGRGSSSHLLSFLAPLLLLGPRPYWPLGSGPSRPSSFSDEPAPRDWPYLPVLLPPPLPAVLAAAASCCPLH